MIKNIIFCLATFILIVNGFQLFSQNQDYTPFDKEKIQTIIPSQSRFIVNLSGKWEQSFDDQEWTSIDIPGSVPSAQKVIYKRTLKIDRNLIQNYAWHLFIGGIDDQVEVYFNNQFVGKYFGGMTPFYASIPKRMVFDETNTIKLIISPALDAAKKIKEQFIYAKKVYTGIVRELWFVGTPNIWISDLKYSTKLKDASDWNVKTSVSISSAEIGNFLNKSQMQDSLNALGLSKTSVSVESFIKLKSTGQVVAQHSSENIVIEPVRTITLDMSMNITNPQLWSPDSPTLYEVYVKVTRNGQLVDELSSNLGFKKVYIQTLNNVPQIWLNGKILDFKGVDYIEDYGNTNQTLSFSRMEKDIMLLKTLGANIVRFKYTVPNPYLLYLCDKFGLFALIELPLFDTPPALLALNEIKVRMSNIAERVVSAYDNHPAVLAWGLMDGVPEGSFESDDFTKSLISTIRSSSDKMIYKTVLFGSKLIDMDGFDFIGIRDNRRYKSSEDIRSELDRMRNLAQNKPVFVTFGNAIQPNNHNGYSDPLSIEYQAFYILNLYHIVHDKKFIGSIVWSFNDYELNNPLLLANNDNQYLSTSGLVDRYRQQRLSFSTLQALFNQEKEPLLNAGSYSEKTPLIFILVGLIMSILIIFLINRFRRFREYIFRAALRPYNFYADIRDQRIMSTVQTFILGAVISVTLGIFFSSILFHFRNSEIAQLLYMLLIPFNILQEWLFKIIWIPEFLVLTTSIVFYLFIFLFAILIKLFSLFVRGRIYYSDTYTITIWAGSPLIVLLPFSIVLIRILVFSPALVWLILSMFALIGFWVLLRILRSTAVVFDIQSIRVYGIGFGFIAVLMAILFSVYQYQFSIFSYVQFLFR